MTVPDEMTSFPVRGLRTPVKAAATSVNSGDARLRALNVPRGMRVPARLRMGLTKLRQPILGFEMAGRVDAVGPGVSGLQPRHDFTGVKDLDVELAAAPTTLPGAVPRADELTAIDGIGCIAVANQSSGA